MTASDSRISGFERSEDTSEKGKIELNSRNTKSPTLYSPDVPHIAPTEKKKWQNVNWNVGGLGAILDYILLSVFEGESMRLE